ncbi:TRAP transporter small permease [Oceanobacter antarcticus]|uniref:TRAP transporter small permease protein n=1 Tax=Oceanobacter antarcticus TaxID=3133425 RepID=A0ABW8NJY3_9GAMM
MKHSPLRRLLSAIHTLEDGLLVLVLLIMVLLAGIDIVARSVFGGGVMWIPPALRVMVLWLGLLGGMVATRGREHIAIDLVNRLAPKAVSEAISVVTSAFAAFICAIVAWNGYAYIELAIEFGDIAFGKIPAWPLQLIIPFSFTVMALRFAIQSLEAVIKVLGKHPAAEAHS